MNEHMAFPSFRDRFRSWLYKKCFAYCVRCVHPDADPSEFCIMDMANFRAISNDEIHELIDEAPEIAWHFASEPL